MPGPTYRRRLLIDEFRPKIAFRPAVGRQPSSTKGLLERYLGNMAMQRRLAQGKGGVPPQQQVEDWNFDRNDYARLSGQLKFDSDSNWLPKGLRENVLKTIHFVLGTKNPIHSQGINTIDLFHGHVVLPFSHKKSDLHEQIVKKARQAKEKQDKAVGGAGKDVTTSNLTAFQDATLQGEKGMTSVLEKALEVPGMGVLYHTFEGDKPPGITTKSPERNILTLQGQSPKPYDGYVRQNISKIGSGTEYFEVFEFSFLVDQNAVIHATVGGIVSFSKFAGKPVNLDLDLP